MNHIFNCDILTDYLDLLSQLNDYMIIVSVKDTAGYWLDDNIQNRLYKIGLKESLINKLFIGYIALIKDKNIIFEKINSESGAEEFHETIDNVQYDVVSKSYKSGNEASIKINGIEYAVNDRGLNIVVLNLKENKIEDSVCFDTHEKSLFCTRILPHYDIGVIGLWWGSNYGSCLNGYAVYKSLTSLGKSVWMINHHYVNSAKNSIHYKFAKDVYPSYAISPSMPIEKYDYINNKCDTFLAGSDQIWKWFFTKAYNYEFMLKYIDDSKKKISFGSSFGHGWDSTPEEALPKAIEYMQKFNAVSVREPSGAKICRDVYGIKAEVVVEPVFCLLKEDYDDIISKSEINETDPYILTYILDPTPQKRQAIIDYSKLLGIKAINVLDLDPNVYDKHKKELDLPNILDQTSPQDLMKLYSNAEFVITDSFHGTCFSIIFNKKFISITNFVRGAVRFPELLKKYGLSDRLVKDPKQIPVNESYLKEIDYGPINEIISKERERSLEWLRYAVETPKDKLPSIILPKNISATLDMQQCTGCGACAALCPTNAIDMTPNENGFINPVVDNDKCIFCKKCTDNCVALAPGKRGNSDDPKCYAVMADDNVRKESSSGGMFTLAAEYILGLNGYVCGAAFDENFNVKHIIINDKNDLDKLRGSKYIQSNAAASYPKIKELLKQDKYVLFTGMPCQVAALYSFLGKDYEKLFTIDLLCHGITSQKVFDKYRHDVLEKGVKKLVDIKFKAKEPWGWHAGVNAYFSDGTKYSQPLEKDPYYIAYLNSISKNSACEVCRTNRLPRQGDLTMGDFWGISNFDPSLNDGKGTSVVLANNSKGEAFLHSACSNAKIIKEAPLKVAKDGNLCIEHPYKNHKNNMMFFKYLDELPFDSLAEGCRNNNLYEKIHNELMKKVPKEDMEYYYIAQAAVKNAKGRKIVTWIHSEKFEQILQKYFNLSSAFGISMRKEALKPGYVEDFSILKGNRNQYYLVSFDRAYDEATYKTLNDYGYTELKDFIFRKHKPIVLENFDLSKGNYYDDYGNSIEGFNAKIGRVIFNGYNNHIVLGKNIPTANKLTFSMTSNCHVEIGNNTRFQSDNMIQFLQYNGSSSVIIGENCRFWNSLFKLFNDAQNTSSITIGNGSTFESDLEMHANQGKQIIIGKDCMFSYGIDVWAGDGHTVFDVKTGKNINSDFYNIPDYKNQLVIGDHVWVGKGAFIMHGTNIGNGSIVGAKSVVKGQYPNNCSLAGNPAKILRENVAWSREIVATDLKRQCGSEEYVRLTSHSKPSISGLNVLVIGGTRFMGVRLVNRLIELGNDVTILTRGNKKDNFGMFVKRLKLDVNDCDECRKVLSGKSYDIIFDNISCGSVGVENLLSNVEFKKYIQLSSIAVYPQRHTDMKESVFNPLDFLVTNEIVKLDYSSPKYGYGKRLAEAFAHQSGKGNKIVSVRIPYVAPTDRLYYYCSHIIKGIPMDISDPSNGFTFVRDTEVGEFLPWIAAQDFNGTINLASTGFVTTKMILNHISDKTGKAAVIDTEKGDVSPFRENTFSLNMDKAKQLGYQPSDINNWFWRLMDEYIERALRENK